MTNTSQILDQSSDRQFPVRPLLYWKSYHLLRMLRWRMRASKGHWILGRHACLGADVLDLIGGDVPVLNLQKCRADYLLAAFASRTARARTHLVDRFFRNRQILPMIAAEEQPYWDFLGSPSAIYMDSFSELTDQMYGPQDCEWRFCANHSDLDHSGTFDRHFCAHGLLPVGSLDEHYWNLFSFFKDRFGDIPVIYLHFPSALEKREKFISRASAITEVINRLRTNFVNLHVFEADPAVVDWPAERPSDNRHFPYHYNDRTYRDLCDQVRRNGLDRLFHRSSS